MANHRHGGPPWHQDTSPHLSPAQTHDELLQNLADLWGEISTHIEEINDELQRARKDRLLFAEQLRTVTPKVERLEESFAKVSTQVDSASILLEKQSTQIVAMKAEVDRLRPVGVVFESVKTTGVGVKWLAGMLAALITAMTGAIALWEWLIKR